MKLLVCHPLQKKWSFPLRISSVNVIKSAVSLITELLKWKVFLLCRDKVWAKIRLSKATKSFRDSLSHYLKRRKLRHFSCATDPWWHCLVRQQGLAGSKISICRACSSCNSKKRQSCHFFHLHCLKSSKENWQLQYKIFCFWKNLL